MLRNLLYSLMRVTVYRKLQACSISVKYKAAKVVFYMLCQSFRSLGIGSKGPRQSRWVKEQHSLPGQLINHSSEIDVVVGFSKTGTAGVYPGDLPISDFKR
jgi:hypothetical protein